ncbi:MAG: AAA family ATPase [Actinomycetota bacterium]|nr:AAA family ATPase [Actinomycetota bacterium]
MKLTALELINFGKFDELKVDFDGGLNLVIGPNEAGKSTIQAAVRVAFFGERQGLARWKRWGTQSPACSIKVEYELADGARWELERDLEKNDVRLVQKSGGEAKVDGPTQVAKVVCGHLGLDTPEAFTNTVFVRVGELATKLKEIEGSLRARVESLLVGADGGSITGARKALDSRYKRLAGTVSQKGAGGQVGELLAEEAGLRSGLAAAEQAENDRKQLVVELETTEARLVEQEARLKVLSELVAAIQSKQSIEQKQEKLSEDRQKIRLKVDRIKADREKRRAIEAEMAGLADYKNIAAADTAVVQGKLKDMRAKEMELAAAADGGQARISPAQPPYMVFAAAVAALVAGAGLAAAGRLALGALLATVGAAGLVAGYILSRPPAPAVDSRAIYIKDEMNRLDQEIKEVLAKVGAADVGGFVAKHAKYDSLAHELANITHAESIMLEGGSLEELEKELGILVDKTDVLDRQLEASTSADLSPEEIFSRERELSYLGPEVANLRRARDTLAGRLQSHQQLSGPPPQDLKAKLLYVGEQLAKTRQYAAAVELAAKEIESIAAEISSEVAPEIAAKASIYLDKLTAGRYAQVNIDADLTPAAVGESGEVAAVALSTGTADQLHFAVRLAAADLISGESRPPVILDDPFVYFDSDRTSAARDITATLAKERQVILFSHDESFKDWPGKTIKLA